MRKMSNYTEAEKAQILEEVKATGNIASVAKKNDIPVGTIYTWVNPKKRKDIKAKLDYKTLYDQSKIKVALLESENSILKTLLKKTYQIWQVD
jgi:transposase-like protein